MMGAPYLVHEQRRIFTQAGRHPCLLCAWAIVATVGLSVVLGAILCLQSY